MKQWLPAVLALIVGLAVGLLIPRGDSPASRVDNSQAKATPGAEPSDYLTPAQSKAAPEVEDGNVPPDEPDASTRDSTKAPSPRVLPDKLLAALKGTGTLQGQASNPDGTPAAGVVLIAKVSNAVPDSEHAAEIRKAFEHRCVTAEDGSFTFTGLQQHYISIKCESASLYAKDITNAGRLALRPGDFARLLILPTATLQVTVLGTDDQELPIASVSARMEDGTNLWFQKAWTPEDRDLQVLPGRMTLRAATYADPYVRAELTLEIEPGEPAEVTLKLQPPVGLYLEMRPPDPWYDRTDYYLLTETDAATFKPDVAMSRSSNGVPRIPIGLHSLVFPDLAAGEYVLVVLAEYAFEIRRLPIHFDGGTTKQILDLEPLVEAEHLMLRVLGLNGEVRLDAHIGAASVTKSGRATAIGAKAMAGDGTWWVRIRDNELKTVQVTASVPRVGTLDKEIPVTLGVVHDLRLRECTTIKVHVAGLTSELMNRLELLVQPQDTAQPLKLGGGGVFGMGDSGIRDNPRIAKLAEFADVPIGEAEIIVNLSLNDRYFRAGPEVLRQSIQVGKEKNEFWITLPKFHALRVRVPAGSATDLISLQTGNHWSSATAIEGVAAWPIVPSGDFRLTDSRTGVMSIRVDGDTELDWQPLPFNCLRLVRLDTDGLLAAAGFAEEDVILTFDGRQYEGYDPLSQALQAARTADAVRLEVDRKGESLIIEVEGAKLDAGLKAAGFGYERR
jgi:hypothetical protein